MLNAQPDGRNINLGCGSVHPEVVCAAVRRAKAHVGLTHDGDADRVLLCDERGRLVDGDQMLAICALDLQARGLLAGGGVVGTVMSNYGLELALKKAGIALERAPVGDRYVVEAMQRGGYVLGGEQSGHIVFFGHQTTGDGIITALQVLAVMQRTGRTLSKLAGGDDALSADPAQRADRATRRGGRRARDRQGHRAGGGEAQGPGPGAGSPVGHRVQGAGHGRRQGPARDRGARARHRAGRDQGSRREIPPPRRAS